MAVEGHYINTWIQYNTMLHWDILLPHNLLHSPNCWEVCQIHCMSFSLQLSPAKWPSKIDELTYLFCSLFLEAHWFWCLCGFQISIVSVFIVLICRSNLLLVSFLLVAIIFCGHLNSNVAWIMWPFSETFASFTFCGFPLTKPVPSKPKFHDMRL